MSEVSKNELKYQNSVSFPNNNSGEISPADLRNFNVELIDSTVNQTQYTSDSSSFDGRVTANTDAIASLNQFTSSLTQSIGVIEGEIQSLESFTASIEIFTQSIQADVSQLLVASTSFEAKFDYIATQSGSWGADTGSYLTTGSNTFNGNQTINGDVIISGALSVTSSNAYFRDILMDDPGATVAFLQNPNYFSEFYGNALRWQEGLGESNLIIAEKQAWTLLNGWSGSAYDEALYFRVDGNGVSFQDWDGSYTPQTWLNIAQKLGNPSFKRSIEVTGSVNITEGITASLQEGYVLVGDSSGRTHIVPTSSFEENTDLTSLNQFTASQELLNTTFATTASFNEYTASNDQKVSALEGFTASQELLNTTFATTGSNIFIGAQTISGSVSISGSLNQSFLPAVDTQTNLIQIVGGIAPGTAPGAVYNYINNSYANYSFANAYKGWLLEHWDSLSYNYGNDFSIGPSGLYFNLVPSASVNQGAELRIRDNYNGTSFAQIYAGTMAIGATNTTTLTIGNSNTTNTISGSLIVSGSQTNNGNVTLNNSTLQVNGFFDVNTALPGANSQYDWFNWAPFTGSNGTIYQYASVGLQNYGPAVNNAFMVEYANASFEKYCSLRVGQEYGGFTIGTGTGYDFDVMEIIDNNDNTTTARIKSDQLQITGSVSTSGSVNGNVASITISSNTASLDFGSANFFTLELVSGSDTRIEPLNVKTGQTVNLKVLQPSDGIGTITFPSQFKFPEVAPYTASIVTSSIDVVTFVTFEDTSSIYSVATKRLV